MPCSPRSSHQGCHVATKEEPLELYRPGGYHPVHIGDTLCHSRYTIIRKLGWGQYSTVWLAKDAVMNCHVALKILTDRAGKGNTKLDEVPILKHVAQSSPNHPGRVHVALLLDHFEHSGPNGDHVCMTFEPLGETVATLQKRFTRRAMPIPLVKQISLQTLLALDFLHHSCDAKPDNILINLTDAENTIQRFLASTPVRAHPVHISSPNAPKFVLDSQPVSIDSVHHIGDQAVTIKLTDFGVSAWLDKYHVDVIQSPALRAPEVLVKALWDTSVDIWGFACVMYYLSTGRWLFNPKPSEDPKLTTEEEHLVQIITLLGESMDLIRTARSSSDFFNLENGDLTRIVIPPTFMTNLEEVVKAWMPASTPTRDLKGLTNVLARMLRIRPADRATAMDLMLG